MKDPDDKRLMNEVLPDPTRVAGRGTPRERIADHMKRLLAAAGLALAPAIALADTTVPDGKGNAKPPEQKKPDGDKKPDAPQSDPPGYVVVDPVPEPYIEKKGEPGFVRLSSKPSCAILIDGKDSGLKTPQRKLKLTPGVHTITLKPPAGYDEENLSLDVRSGHTEVIVKDLRESKPKAPPKPADPPK